MESLKHHIVTVEECGPVSCYIQGDLEKQRDGAVFLTVHDVGCTVLNWHNFVMHPAMEDIRKRALFIHVSIPGQELGAPDLPDDFKFPKMKDLGLNLVSVLDSMRVPRVVGLGNGAGANIITRFGMFHPSRVHGIVTINNIVSASLGRFVEKMTEKLKVVKTEAGVGRLNVKNAEKFADAFKDRTEILQDLNKKINFDMLLIAGTKNSYLTETDAIQQQMTPGLCSMIKIEDVSEPCTEAPHRVAEALLLFCQGIGLLPSVRRRVSRQGSMDSSDGDSFQRKNSCIEVDPSIRHHVVSLEVCGAVSVYVQGGLDKHKEGVVFLTVHDVGASYLTWKQFVQDTSMDDIRKRASFIHVALPGQIPGERDLPKDFIFPKMKDLGLHLVSILDYFRIKQVVGLGDGAGANIITRFGMCHPSRVHGILTINNRAGASMGRFMEGLKTKMKSARQPEQKDMNEKNVSLFAESYKKRSDIIGELNKKVNFDMLLMAGAKSKYVADSELIHTEVVPGLCSIIKVEEISEPLLESPARVAEAVLLFCQGVGLLPSIARKFSRQVSL